MDITHNLKNLITGALVSGTLAVAGLGLAAGSALASHTWATGPYRGIRDNQLPRDRH